jgi:hypothetical protein
LGKRKKMLNKIKRIQKRDSTNKTRKSRKFFFFYSYLYISFFKDDLIVGNFLQHLPILNYGESDEV